VRLSLTATNRRNVDPAGRRADILISVELESMIKGSTTYPSTKSILLPCRIVMVVRSRDQLEIRGETHLAGQPAVAWHVRTFSFGADRSREEIEDEANEAALAFATSTPLSFTGHVYLVDSRNQLTKVRPAAAATY
jgi:hypothetical protein